METRTDQEPRSNHRRWAAIGEHLGLRHLAIAVIGLVGIVAFVWYRAHLGDYDNEVAPAVDALARGDFSSAVAHQANIGPFSVVLRAPLVALTNAFGGNELVGYRVGAVPCVAASGLLATAFLAWLPAARRSRLVGALIVLLAVATPVAADALDLGHPEEILGSALSVGAVVAALRGKNVWAAVFLGLALSTKQWALLAIGPVMLAAGRRYWWRVTAGAGAITVLLLLPLLFANHQRLERATREAASAPLQPRSQSWWFLFFHNLPDWLPQLTKPTIVLLAVPLTVFAYWRRIGPAGALPILALLFLLRCTLDPQTQYYYHLPLLLTLLAWDVQMRRRLPYAALGTLALLVITNSYLASSTAALHRESAFYLAWTVSLTVYLLVVVVRLAGPARTLWTPSEVARRVLSHRAPEAEDRQQK